MHNKSFLAKPDQLSKLINPTLLVATACYIMIIIFCICFSICTSWDCCLGVTIYKCVLIHLCTNQIRGPASSESAYPLYHLQINRRIDWILHGKMVVFNMIDILNDYQQILRSISKECWDASKTSKLHTCLSMLQDWGVFHQNISRFYSLKVLDDIINSVCSPYCS